MIFPGLGENEEWLGEHALFLCCLQRYWGIYPILTWRYPGVAGWPHRQDNHNEGLPLHWTLWGGRQWVGCSSGTLYYSGISWKLTIITLIENAFSHFFKLEHNLWCFIKSCTLEFKFCLFDIFQHRIKNILESWLKVQAAWLYLEPIFGSQDIRNQIPVEGKMFEEVDEHWSVAGTYKLYIYSWFISHPCM